MSYATSWTNQDASGHVSAGGWIAAADVSELGAAVDRRIRLMFDPNGDWPSQIAATGGEWITAGPLETARGVLADAVPTTSYFAHDSGWEQLNTLCSWLWPQADADENKAIVNSSSPGGGEVSFFGKLNGGTTWTGELSGARPAAAPINELRDAARMLRRGRYTLWVGDGGAAKASKALPGGLWLPPAVARDGDDEMHSWFGGRDWLWVDDGEDGWLGPRGQSVTVLESSRLRLKPLGSNRKVKVYHSRYVDPDGFTWAAGQAATGDHITDLELTNNTWTEYGSEALTGLLQEMADGGAEPSFKLAPDEATGWGDDPTHIAVEVVVEFELDGPPA
ncbi:MAG: hypothetical protein BIFFINMI_02913 [Phycisphaerae bacterium]|nr:hypothetical protein [Phycisphaerae bacterium]